MPNADFFRRLGLFVLPQFLEAEVCERLRAEVASARQSPATVRAGAAAYDVDETTRKTALAEVSPGSTSLVEQRVLALKPELESHFGVSLAGCQPLQFLVYKEGDFFRAHRDSAAEHDAAEFSRRRQVSVVIFLNGESDDGRPDTYSGGALTFYGVFGNERGKQVGLPLVGEPGLLIAFGTDVVHEVTAVTRGERYTITTWLY